MPRPAAVAVRLCLALLLHADAARALSTPARSVAPSSYSYPAPSASPSCAARRGALRRGARRRATRLWSSGTEGGAGREGPPPSAALSRRSALWVSAAATLALFPPTRASAAAPLEALSLGTATWSDAADAAARRPASAVPLSARIVPPSFATYLARFLLHYDAGASAWWGAQRESFSQLPAYDAQGREGRSFGAYAASVRRGLYAFVAGEGEGNIGSYDKVRGRYAALLGSLLDKYGGDRGAVRDAALLFAMLPVAYQPMEELRALDERALAETGTNAGTKSGSFPPNFQEDFALLLPNKYRAAYDPTTKAFLIAPDINLFEIPINDGDSIATTFGPLSSAPLSRERAFTLDVYALLALSGGAGCALTHTLVVPLDVVKTRIQTDPGRYAGVLSGAAAIAREEGPGALYLGTQATVAGYLWYGLSVYPCYAFFKRCLGEELLSPAFAVAHAGGVALVAGALASVVASLGLTPTEACRIRAVARPERYRALGLAGTLGAIVAENPERGWRGLYAGLPSLMTRQVVFGSVKFLAFERASEAIFAARPELRGTTATALGVSLVAGGLAGALSSVVSQPADAVLTYVAKQEGGQGGLLEGARTMVEKEGAASLFRGLGSRSVWAGCIIGGQFLLYDVFRAFFGISGDDLNQVLEVVLPKNL